MATDDQQILVTGGAATPAHFTIPGNGQIRPKAVFASFDGTSAGVAFLPALKIISDGGETVGIYPTDTTVAAGASADVSWFPRLAAAAASASLASSIVRAYGFQFSGQTVTHGTRTTAKFDTVATSDATKLSWSTNTHTNDTLTLHGNGWAQVITSCLWTAGTKIDARILSSGGYEVFPHDGFDSMSGYDNFGAGNQQANLMDIAWYDTTASTLPLQVQLSNLDGADSGPTLCYIGAMFYPGLQL